MEQERIWSLIAREISGEASEKELRELQDLLQNNSDISDIMETLYSVWRTSGSPRESADQAYVSLIQKMKQRRISFH
jgi:hypothetical protein